MQSVKFQEIALVDIKNYHSQRKEEEGTREDTVQTPVCCEELEIMCYCAEDCLAVTVTILSTSAILSVNPVLLLSARTAMWSMPVVLTETENENDSANQNDVAKLTLQK